MRSEAAPVMMSWHSERASSRQSTDQSISLFPFTSINLSLFQGRSSIHIKCLHYNPSSPPTHSCTSPGRVLHHPPLRTRISINTSSSSSPETRACSLTTILFCPCSRGRSRVVAVLLLGFRCGGLRSRARARVEMGESWRKCC